MEDSHEKNSNKEASNSLSALNCFFNLSLLMQFLIRSVIKHRDNHAHQLKLCPRIENFEGPS